MHEMFRKVALLGILRSLLLTELQAYSMQFPNFQNELLTEFLKGALKLKENSQDRISNGVPYEEFTDLQTVAFTLGCF